MYKVFCAQATKADTREKTGLSLFLPTALESCQLNLRMPGTCYHCTVLVWVLHPKCLPVKKAAAKGPDVRERPSCGLRLLFSSLALFIFLAHCSTAMKQALAPCTRMRVRALQNQPEPT